MKLISLVDFLSDKYEAIFADNVDFPEPEFPKINIFLEFIILVISFDESFLDNSLKKETLPSSEFFPINE